MLNLPLYQFFNLAVATTTNICSIYLTISMIGWILRLRYAKTELRPLVYSLSMAKFALWFWSGSIMFSIIFENSDPLEITLPARLLFLVVVLIQCWMTVRVRPESIAMAHIKPLIADGRMVLIVEDNELLARIYRRVLEMNGFNAEFATSGTDALFFIEQETPSLILVDLGLPDMNGVEFVKMARVAGYVGPVLAISGAISLVDEGRLAAASFVEMLQKPVTNQQLITAVARWANWKKGKDT